MSADLDPRAARSDAAGPSVEATDRVLQETWLLAEGAYAPLRGFQGRADYEAVLDGMRTSAGQPWAIPVTLPLPEPLALQARAEGSLVLLRRGAPAARVRVEEVFRRDLAREARLVYGTEDPRHPGVAVLHAQSPWVAAGPVEHLAPPDPPPGVPRGLRPDEARALFRERGFRTVVGFQTRNAPHRGHEHLLRLALELGDGLFIHPIIGARADGDLPAGALLRAYEAFAGEYLPAQSVIVSPLLAPMRYAGPREAVHHALVRRNYGCTHFIVGRDHAGVGAYYGPYDAHRIFDRFEPRELGVEILRFSAAFRCERCDGYATERSCPHGPEFRTTVSGTQFRAAVRTGEGLGSHLVRPEVLAAVRQAMGGVAT